MKRMAQKAAIVILSLAFIMGMPLAAESKDAAAESVKIEKLTVSSPSGRTAYVAKGKSVKLAVTVKTKSKKKADKKVLYKSANKKIATVNGQGVVKGIKAGKTKVTAVSSKDKKKKAAIKIVVKNVAVKSVKLKEKSAVISVGKKKALKAEVAPKKASNRLVWSSSKKSVASVSDKGVITGKKAGTAVITAKAADGSGKKAVFKVTVTKSVNMASMDVQNVQTITFELDRAQALTADKILVKTKVYERGEYRNQLKIDNISTSDNINYTVILNNESRIQVNDFVQVSVPSLTGTVKSLEMEYNEQICAFMEEEISVWSVNKYSSDNFTFGSSYGYSSYTITGLPAGLTSKADGDCMYVTGIPTTVGNTTATLRAVDEKGNTLTKSIYFIVGSENKVVGAGMPVYSLAANAEENNVNTYAQFSGGEGYYYYEIINDGGMKAEIIDSSNNTVHISAWLADPGEHSITVRALDSYSRFCDVVIPIYISQGVTVSGTVRDAAGNPIPFASIEMTNKNRADRFFRTGSFTADKNGFYSSSVSAGTYDIEVRYKNNKTYFKNSKTEVFLYNKEISASLSGFDLYFPLYKVSVISADPDRYPLMNSNGYYNFEWYVNNECVGEGDTLYLKNGTYTIESVEIHSGHTENTTGDWFNGVKTTYVYTNNKLTGRVTVNGSAAQVIMSKSPDYETTQVYSTLPAKDTTFEVKTNSYKYLYDTGGYGAYFFVPTKTGSYGISGDYVKIYNMAGHRLSARADGMYDLEAGTKYIIGADGSKSECFEIYSNQ